MPDKKNNLEVDEFILKTEPPMVEINSNSTPGLFKRFFVRDSILNYYPYMEFVINDDAGFFIEDNFFTEGLKWDLQWRYTEEEKDDSTIYHSFYWSEHQLPGTQSQDIAAGSVIVPMLSHFRFQDYVKSKSWKNNISTIVKQIVNEYNYPNDKPKSQNIKITDTVNNDYWYQTNITDGRLINEVFSRYAYNPAYKNSPFFSYFNLRGEFHFEALEKILQQKPKAKFVYGSIDKDFSDVYLASQKVDKILNFKIVMLGAPVNMENWNREFYYLSKSAEFKKQSLKLSDKLDKLGKNKFNLRRDYLTNPRKISSFGIVDNSQQENMYKGWVNNEFLNSTSFPFRLMIFTNFRPDIVAGDLIETEFTSSIEDKDFIAQEFSGKWTVIESTHAKDQRGNSGSSFIIGKNSINIFKEHRFFDDFF